MENNLKKKTLAMAFRKRKTSLSENGGEEQIWVDSSKDLKIKINWRDLFSLWKEMAKISDFF